MSTRRPHHIQRDRRRALASAVVLLGMVMSGPSQAFQVKQTPSGEVIQWPSTSVQYVVDPTTDQAPASVVKGAVNAGFSVWTAVPTSYLRLEFAGAVSGVREGFHPSGENQNVVRFEESNFLYDDSVLAVTLLTFETETGVLLDADIVVNSGRFEFTVDPRPGSGGHDIQNTIAHEAGHFVGLAHETTDDAATMFPMAPPEETGKRSLGRDDQDGISFLYPVVDDGQEGPVMTPGPQRLPDSDGPSPDPAAEEPGQSVSLDRVQIGVNCRQAAGQSGSGRTWLLFLLVSLGVTARRRRKAA